MTKEEYEKLSEIIVKQLGIRLGSRDYNRIKKIVKERTKRLKFKSSHEYITHLSLKTDIDEWEEFTNNITVPETYFFRDINQYNALKNYILPDLEKSCFTGKKKDKKIKIWSAGCSTGEEALTTAIILTESIPKGKHRDMKIIGTDINRSSIEKAKNGVYTKNSFRGVGHKIVEKYFTETSRGFKIKEAVKRLVQYEIFNLKLGDVASFPIKYSGFDVIFCRNVLIYFEENIIKNIFKGFYNALVPGGYLVSGHSEAALVPMELFKPIQTDNTFIYLHKAPARQSLKTATRSSKPETGSLYIAADVIADVISNDKRSAFKMPKSKTGDPQQTDNGKQSATRESQIVSNKNSFYLKALELYFKEKYPEAEGEITNLMIRNDVGIDGLLLAALISMNLDNFEKAVFYVRRLHQKDEFLPEAYFIFGLIHESKNDYTQAVRAYQTALFLNENFFLSYFRLGHLYHKSGKDIDSQRAFKNALKATQPEKEEKIRLLSGGFSFKSLKDICRNRINQVQSSRQMS